MKNKKIFTHSLLLLIFLCSLQGYSQYTNPANYVLPSLIGTQTQYTARDYIKLTPGFTFTATGSTTATTLNAKIDELSIPLVNPNPTSPILANDPALEIDTLLPVAAIPGKAGVSGSGAATYEIPIGMPPGTKGMVPNLSIVYNSQAGNGIMGLGWNISGLSAITRIPQTFYKNGNTTAVDFSANDRFALDGNRLVQTVGTVYGANNAEYHTESENFSKIISYGTSGTGPSYFTVTTTDGSVIEYGNTNDSRFVQNGTQTVYSWHINKITDRFGNYMLFKYRTVNNELIIDQIEYTGNANANLSPYNKVKFYYEEKTDKSFYYVGGVKLQQNLLLSKIKVYAETQIRDEYTFDYYYDIALTNHSNPQNATKLKKVSLMVNGNTNLNATKILWYDNSVNFQSPQYSNIPLYSYGSITCTSRKSASGDFDGDGIDEVLVIDGYYLNNSIVSPNWKGYHWAMYKFTVSGATTCLGSGSWSNAINESNVISIYPCDINMDGKTEFYIRSIVKTILPNGSTYYNEYNHLYNFTANGNNGTLSMVSNNGYADEYTNNTSYNFKSEFQYYCPWEFQLNEMLNRRESKIFDYNGDGKPDYLTIIRNYGGTSSKDQIKIYLNTGNGFKNSLREINIDYVNSVSNLERVEIVDFNGDGKSDIMVIRKTAQNNYTDLCNSQLITHNLCAIYEYKAVTDPNCNPFTLLYNSNYPTQFGKFFTGDYNGDGKTDIMRWEANTWQVLYNNGNNTFDWTPVTITTIPSYMANRSYFVRDWDHDGKDDFICFLNAGVNVFLSKGGSFIEKSSACAFNLSDLAPISDQCSYPTSYIGMTSSDIVLGDFTGKNKTDIFGWFYFLIDPQPQILFYKVGDYSNFVSSIYNGYKNNDNFFYQPLTSNTVYNKHTNSVFPILDIQPPTFVVSTHRFVNSSFPSQTSDNTYFYEGLKNHITDRKSLGFSRISVSNTKSGTKAESTYELIGSFNQPMLVLSKSFANSGSIQSPVWQEIASTSYINQANEYPGYPNCTAALESRRSFYFQKQTNSFDNINDVKKESKYIYGPVFGSSGSSSGTIIIEEKTFNSVNSASAYRLTTTETTKTFPQTYSTWFPSLVTLDKIRHTVGVPYEVSKKYEYYANDNLQYVIDNFLNDNFNVKKEFSQYNSFGIPEKIKTHPPVYNPDNLSIVEQTNTYDNKGRFLTEDKNTLNQITTYSYEPKFGNLLKVTDLNGLETKFEYDAIGRKKKTINADNTEESVAYNWANGSSYPSNSLYKITASSSGDPNVVSYYDALGRAFRTETTNFNNELIRTTTSYDEKGRVYQSSLPYLASSSLIKYSTNTYDYLGRLTHQENPDASSFTHIIYSATTPRLTTVQTGGTNITTQDKKTQTNCLGQAEYVEDNINKKVNYLYNSAGQLTESWVDGMSNHITMTYNLQGKQLSINDPDAGLTTSVYDAYGQLRIQKDGKQNTVNNPLYGTSTTYNYDALGRVTTVIQPEFTNTYSYGSAAPNINKLLSVVSVNSTSGSTTSNTYQYDALGRSVQTTEAINDNGVSKSFTLSNDYDSYGRVNTITYPDNNLKIKYDYQNGELKAVKRLVGTAESNIWQANTQDLLGNYNNYTTGFNTGAWTTAKTYNQDNGRLISIKTGPSSNRIQDLTYTYDNIGNLTSRTENMYNSILSYQKEDFNYDNLNRLNGITYSNNVSTSPLKTINYDNGGLGNITTMPDVGNFTYDPQRLHAITQITNNPGNINTTQQVDYTSFNKVLKLEDGQSGTAAFKKLMFKYGPDYSRRKTSYYESTSAISVDKYFALGCYEEEINNATGIAVKDFYINAGDGLAAIYRITGTNPTGVMYYIHKDNMGSFDKVTNESGAVVDRYSFDAWGNRRNYDNWTLSDNTTHLFSRGYTGHEHLDKFGLINMNGRLYDSKLGRFLSPDPVLQDASNTQNYNRYSYCLNNPFKYTDPSGFTYYEDYAYWTNLMAPYVEWNTNKIIRMLNSSAGITWADPEGFYDGPSFLDILEQIRPDFEMGDAIDNDGNPYSFNSMKFTNGSSYEYREYANGTTYNLTNMAGMVNTIDNRYSYEDMNYADTDDGKLNKLRAGWGTNVGGMSYKDPPYIYNGITYSNSSDLYFSILIDQTAEQFGIKDIISLAAAFDYAIPSIKKPFVTPNSAKVSTYASKYGSKLLPYKMPFRLPTHLRGNKTMYTKVLGRFLGRMAGPVGWAILAYDVSKIFYDTQVLYNNITE